MEQLIKNNPKVINAWCSYDMANSAYNLIISTAIFPVYYQGVTSSVFKSSMLPIFGTQMESSVLYDYAVAVAYFLIIILTPLLSGIADVGGYRKRFMQSFTLLGAASCIGLYWFSGPNFIYALTLVMLAVLGYAGSLVYYNSFLPIIATPDQHDKISARGFSWGYAGSTLLLIVCLVLIIFYKKFGFENDLQPVRLSFLLVGIWWLLVSQIAFRFLKEYPAKFKMNSGVFTKGFSEIFNVAKIVFKQRPMRMFLIAFLFFSMGVQTIILVAALFGSTELGIKGDKLIMTILIIQIVAIFGAWLFGKISSTKGNKTSLIIMLVIWILVCISAKFITGEIQFYILGAMVGLVMGGIQSQARSTYSKLIPEDTTDTASYFSFYDITEKIAIVCGMFSFGFIQHQSGSMRNSALMLSVFFSISLIIICFTKLPRPIKTK
ncbi:MAG TPA: MFS transporter [Bacteroidales bacterium]|nr:MFS transporter [Bacteroidales bacterium]